ncbi:hypothetical protein DM992_20600 [Burkholderia sp. JP2-270]|nr:hypothetical protein DM992_20600 [Burkholderia sp. JP2-270]
MLPQITDSSRSTDDCIPDQIDLAAEPHYSYDIWAIDAYSFRACAQSGHEFIHCLAIRDAKSMVLHGRQPLMR